MVIAAVVIWAGFFVIIFSVISTPLIAWWLKSRAKKTKTSGNKSENHPKTKDSYKLIEAEYEIIEKKVD